ncbi:MAG: 3-deoxy-D-manno-octulosonic acid transferase [Gammaproteobacteria bacterium]|nr:3-deoxy-D-manno-octulosonic acid transferase [Gammaproteobacteria bacterium]
MRLAYVLLSYLVAPLVLLFLLWRGLRNRAYWERLPERFGIGLPEYELQTIWVHAVSVGEVQAAAGLIERLLGSFPGKPLILTTVTPTGAAHAKALFGDRVHHHYAPYDLPGSVSRFFTNINPCIMIVIETELWPTLYHTCGVHKVPLILASARISPRSVGKYRRFVRLFSEALSHGIVIAAQSESDAERFRSLGANPSRTHTTGNIKFDFELPAEVYKKGRLARQQHAANRPVLVAASTHDNEEALVLDAMRKVWTVHPTCLLIIAPRHPERFELVARILDDRGLSYVTRTSRKLCSENTQVLLLDTLGELRNYYAACDVAFVGGSLVPVGGHNLLEPAALAKPIISGTHLFNTEDVANKMVTSGAALLVDSTGELADRVIGLLSDESTRRIAGAAGKKVVDDNRGALDKLIELIEPLLVDDRQAINSRYY